MTLKNHITDPGSGIEAQVFKKNGNGLYVITDPKTELTITGGPMTNATYGQEMAQDGSASGTPDKVHNGTDDALWTASAISGTWVFDSTDQAHTGTKSIDATATVNDSVAQFAKGSDLTISSYNSITGWIYATSWPVVGV